MRRFLYQFREVKQTGEQHHSFELLWQDVDSQRIALKGSAEGYVVYTLPQGRIS